MYRKKSHIHFIGIGGIGMSGIAKILKYQGYTISGCDTDLQQKSVRDLQVLGCSIYSGNNTPECHSSTPDILVYSSIIKSDNPEIITAQRRGIPTIPRAQMLAELMRMKYSIAITGAHGKTTTTSLISHILLEAQYDPTVVIGGHLHALSTNARLGAGDFLVAEADESDRSLLRLHPTLAVVTNIDLEHLDVYKDLDDIKETFKQFLSNLPFYGIAILCHEDPHLRSLLPLSNTKTMTYGFSTDADTYATDIHLEPDFSTGTVWQKNSNQPLGTVTIPMPGIHNILNALGATTLALELGISFEAITSALATFQGVDRRFCFKGNFQGAAIYDDYGHHPTEIHHTLQVARRKASRKLIVVFQPHRYTRTYHLWNNFIETLSTPQIDHLIITDIHAASELPLPGITSQNLVAALQSHNPQKQIEYISYSNYGTQIREKLHKITQPGDLILLLGAGKVNMLAELLQDSSSSDGFDTITHHHNTLTTSHDLSNT